MRPKVTVGSEVGEQEIGGLPPGRLEDPSPPTRRAAVSPCSTMPVLNTAATRFCGAQRKPPWTAPEGICTSTSQRAIASARSRTSGRPWSRANSSSVGMM
jgi:hypothetical protein